MIPVKHFYMIRHGETEANAAEIMAGSLDSPLTENGRTQARAVQSVVRNLKIKPVAIYHSHLSRARDTAELINQDLNVRMFEEPDIAEIHAGDMEGQPYAVSVKMFHDWAQPPNGEAPQDFFDRVKRGKINAIKAHDDGPVLIVCHGGVMRAFGEIHSIPTPGVFKNAHLYEFVPNDNNNDLPWDVYDYEICCETQKILRNKSNVYTKS